MPRKQKPKRRTGHLYLRGTIWWCKYYEAGKPIRESTKTSDHATAEAYLNRKLAGAQRAPHSVDPARVEMSQLFDLVVEDYRRKNRKSFYDLLTRLSLIRDWWSGIRAKDVTAATIQKYVTHRARAVKPATVNRELAIIKRAMSLGAKHEPPLVSRVPHFERLPDAKPRQGTISPDQYRAVRDLLPPHARIALVIAYHTGARKGEIMNVRVADVDFTKRRIRLHAGTTKNDEARWLPIYGDMRTELEIAVASAKSLGCSWLVQQEGARILNFRKAWATACRAAGIPDALFHDLRRVACTNMMDAGISIPDAMAISGHRTDSVFRRYVIANQKRLQESAAKLEAFLKQDGDRKQPERLM